ncbi:hypothetical protein [Rhizobium halophytocola]|uniref:Transmembrane anchored protein n=1 Tax=Rhizobium halophytocola TaxID=735519 RepID=A0ABS4DWC0_9HYPH|nr:hypothetical protein [Rhizobium halophytocola]MBP1849965.1 hypothetical protein [Rhizobium halophytocola]
MSNAGSKAEDLPLLSSGFVAKVTAVVLVIAALSVAINIGARMLGDRLVIAGHTDSTEVLTIVVGQDALRLPANTLRFASQRHSGLTERVDLAFLWPEMSGYRREYRDRFDDVSRSDGLIFLQLSQSTMSRDMSGRLDAIYDHLFEGSPKPFSHGLVEHRLRPGTGFDGEIVLTAARPGEPDYVVRCLMPAAGQPTSSGDCQRDVHVGQDLTVLYRFSAKLLPDWAKLDSSVVGYVSDRVSKVQTADLQ